MKDQGRYSETEADTLRPIKAEHKRGKCKDKAVKKLPEAASRQGSCLEDYILEQMIQISK